MPPLYYLLGDILLTAHRVDGHGGVLQVEQVEQLRDSGDFIGLLIYFDLAEGGVMLIDPRGDHVNGVLLGGPVETPAQRLAVNGDVFSSRISSEVAHKGLENFFEGVGVQGGKDAPEGVVGRDSVFQLQEGLKPLPARLSKLFDLSPALGAAQNGG